MTIACIAADEQLRATLTSLRDRAQLRTLPQEFSLANTLAEMHNEQLKTALHEACVAGIPVRDSEFPSAAADRYAFLHVIHDLYRGGYVESATSLLLGEYCGLLIDPVGKV
jgi:hypothetical protein